MSGQQEPPLEYRNPVDDNPARRRAVGQFFGGGVCGGAVVGVVGFFGFVDFMTFESGGGRPMLHSPFAIGFPVAAVIGGWLFYTFIRPPRRIFWAGFFFGFFVTCLIEGTCFIAN